MTVHTELKMGQKWNVRVGNKSRNNTEAYLTTFNINMNVNLLKEKNMILINNSHTIGCVKLIYFTLTF